MDDDDAYEQLRVLYRDCFDQAASEIRFVLSHVYLFASPTLKQGNPFFCSLISDGLTKLQRIIGNRLKKETPFGGDHGAVLKRKRDGIGNVMLSRVAVHI